MTCWECLEDDANIVKVHSIGEFLLHDLVRKNWELTSAQQCQKKHLERLIRWASDERTERHIPDSEHYAWSYEHPVTLSDLTDAATAVLLHPGSQSHCQGLQRQRIFYTDMGIEYLDKEERKIRSRLDDEWDHGQKVGLENDLYELGVARQLIAEDISRRECLDCGVLSEPNSQWAWERRREEDNEGELDPFYFGEEETWEREPIALPSTSWAQWENEGYQLDPLPPMTAWGETKVAQC